MFELSAVNPPSEKPLTPALSHPMGEGESFAVGSAIQSRRLLGYVRADPKTSDCCSLSHRMREGQGEGFL